VFSCYCSAASAHCLAERRRRIVFGLSCVSLLLCLSLLLHYGANCCSYCQEIFIIDGQRLYHQTFKYTTRWQHRATERSWSIWVIHCLFVSIRPLIITGCRPTFQYIVHTRAYIQVRWMNIEGESIRKKTSSTRSSAVAQRPRVFRVIEYLVKSLKISQGHSKRHSRDGHWIPISTLL